MPVDDDEVGLGGVTNLVPAQNPVFLSGRLDLLVISNGSMTTHALPESGQIEIGRSSNCDIAVPDESMSRRHAVITLGDVVTIEDLGSVNGTTVRGIKLEPRQPSTIGIGELVGVGAASLILQQRSRTNRPRTVWTRDQFQARLEEECAREERSGAPFTLMRLQFGAGAHDLIEETLTAVLRDSDILGKQGSHRYEVLLPDTSPAQADIAVRRIEGTLQQHKLACRIYLACCPRDGRNAAQLDAKAQPAPSQDRASGGDVVIADQRMQDLYRLIAQVAVSDLSVLLLGETGVGKEVLSRSVHRASPRSNGPFVELNCAALAEPLLESELFGHEKGAFTNAVAAKPGLLEEADGGTLFLDEIGDMPLTTQVKLLRVIEDSRLRRVGGLKSRTINVRFIAATNCDIEALVNRGAFRRDLFFRLNGVTILIPPLRERVIEIEPLAKAFAHRAGRRAGTRPVFTPESIDALRRYPWPGNVRELKNVVERAVLLAAGAPITPEHVTVRAPNGTSAGASDKPTKETPPLARPRKGSSEERDLIMQALEQANGNQTRAARLLGISRRTLVNRLADYNKRS